jgi:hypothetical protein
MGDLVIPNAPQALTLRVEREWDGKPGHEGLWAEIVVSRDGDRLRVKARGPVRSGALIPDAAVGTRVANLWEYDVAELFLAGPGERYLEVELGAGGHFLVLGFDGIRQRSDEHADIDPQAAYQNDGTEWISEMAIPISLVPPPLRALNAYAIMGGRFLAYAPVPGEQPDYHQPTAFPPARFS